MEHQINQEIKQVFADWPKMFHKYAQPDTKKAIIQILSSFLPFVGLWVLMYISLDYSYWITFGLGLLNAFFLVRIFIIQHDCGHRSFLKSNTWNKLIGWFCSVFSAIPFKYWARVHDFHHGHSGQLEYRDIGDIHTLTVEEFRNLSAWEKFKYRVFRMPLITFIVGPVLYVFINNRFPLVGFNGWQKTHRSLYVNNALLLGVYLGLGWLLGWKEFLLVQFTIIVLFAIIAVWFFYVQHQHEHNYKHWKESWEYLLAAIRGSTYYKLPKLFQWLTGNIGFHHIHHLNSKIPNYHLEWCARENPILHKYVTEVTFPESLKYMNHKLWDEASEKMISFTAYYRLEKQLGA